MSLVVTLLLILPTNRPLQVDTQQKEALSKNLKIICFATSAQTWSIEPVKIQVQNDVTNLYPSILIYKAIDVILQQLTEGSRKIKKSNANRHSAVNRTLCKWLLFSFGQCYSEFN